MNKKLICNIVNQTKKPIVVISADTTNYYDHIMYPVVSMSNQNFGVQLEYLLVLFSSIQSIKMFLRTSFRVLTTFFTESKGKPF